MTFYREPVEAIYRCKDRTGVVHLAREDSWDTKPKVDETLCGERNYFDRTDEKVTCVSCLAEEEAS